LVWTVLITKVRDNGNIRIQLDKNEINVNVNRIKPFITTNLEEQQQQIQQQQQPQHQHLQTSLSQPQQHDEQKEEEQPWIGVKRLKQKPLQQLSAQHVPKRGRGRPGKQWVHQKTKMDQSTHKTNGGGAATSARKC
jgi:hypothetical protein